MAWPAHARVRGLMTRQKAMADHIQRVAPLFKKWAAEGLSLRAMAEELNARGIPRVHGGTDWAHSTVKTICVRLGIETQYRIITPSRRVAARVAALEADNARLRKRNGELQRALLAAQRTITRARADAAYVTELETEIVELRSRLAPRRDV